jgi:hypothetical protein
MTTQNWGRLATLAELEKDPVVANEPVAKQMRRCGINEIVWAAGTCWIIASRRVIREAPEWKWTTHNHHWETSVLHLRREDGSAECWAVRDVYATPSERDRSYESIHGPFGSEKETEACARDVGAYFEGQ